MEKTRGGGNPKLFEQIRGSNAPGMSREEVEGIILKHFSGKRYALRTERLLDLDVEGSHGTFAAVSVDLSRTGALLRILDSDFAPAEESHHLMQYTACVWHHFANGLWLRFQGLTVGVRGEVARVTNLPGQAGLILVGVKFRRELSPEECKILGIPCDYDRPPGS